MSAHRTLLLHGEMPEPASRPRLAVAAKGFRPFFLLAAIFACAIVPIWILIVLGVLGRTAYLDAATWHAHEMIFGFAVAVIAGFLLTAVGNWTQRETVVGPPLLALAAVWVVGRVAMATAGSLPRGVAAVVDLAFLPLLAFTLARPLVAAHNRRNFIMLGALLALFAANGVIHLDALGLTRLGAGRHASLFAVDVIVFLIVVIAGRVMPMFTRNATGNTSIRSSKPLELLTIGGVASLCVIDAVAPETTLSSIAAGIVGAFTIARAARWGTRSTLRIPLLWILHVGYAWVALGLLLRAAPAVGLPVWGSLATHALTAGAIGSLTLGMMARVALGHTGRPVVASRAMTVGFVAITAAAVVRVLVPLVDLRWHAIALEVAAAFWSIAFAIYVVAYAPVLWKPRADGKPG